MIWQSPKKRASMSVSNLMHHPSRTKLSKSSRPRATAGKRPAYRGIELLESRIAPALVLGISDGQSNTTPGSKQTYTISYSNSGTDGLTGVTLLDTAPDAASGLTFDAAENPGWTLSGGKLNFSIGTLAGGASGEATLILHTSAVAPAGLASVAHTAGILSGTATVAQTTATDSTTLDAAPDLAVTKTHGDATAVALGGNLSYTISYSNVGNQNATGVVLTETLPAGTTFDSANSSTGWTETSSGSGTFTLAVGALTAGAAAATKTFAVKVNATAAAGAETVVNTVKIADDLANGVDSGAGNNTGTDTIALTASPDLGVTVHAAANSVVPGSTIQFDFTYKNTGNQAAKGVVITETLPSFATFSAAANSGWTLNGNILTFAVSGNVAAGFSTGSAKLILGIGNVPAGVEQFSNTATISDDGSSGTDANLGDNTDSDSVTLDATPDLTLTKSDGRDGAVPGKNLTYTLSYANAGHQDATGVVLTDTLPTGTTFDPADNPGWVLNGNTLTFTVGNVAAGANGTATLVLHTSPIIPDGLTNITNTASIAHDGVGGADPTPANNTSTDVDVLAHAVDLTLAKHSTSSIVVPGGSITYTLDYTNAGDVAASGVVLTDTLPAGTTFDPAANPGWVLNGNTLTFAVGNVAADGQGTATLILGIASAAAAGAEHIVNSATIADDGAHGADITLTNNTSSVNVTLNAAADLAVTKDGGGAAVVPGGNLNYHFTYANSGNQHASGVAITDVLLNGLNFSAADNPGWTLNGTTLTYAIGALNAGVNGSADLKLTVATSAPAGVTQFVNTANIADDGTSGPDANTADNTATATNPLTAHVDLGVTLTQDVTTTAPNGTITYTVHYSNTGNQTAAGVVLTEMLPAGTTFQSPSGWTAGTGGLYTFNVGSLAAGASGTQTFVVSVNPAAPAGQETVADTVSIGSSATDSDTTNNTATSSIPLTAAPELGVTQSASVGTLVRGQNVTYSFSYTNNGTQDAAGVVLTETLPAGLTFVAAGSTAGWTAVDATHFTFNVGTLAKGQSATINFQALVGSNVALGTAEKNTVSIADNAAGGADPNPANNTSNLTLRVGTGAPPVVTPSPSNNDHHSSHDNIVARADGDTVKVYNARTGALVFKFHPYGGDGEKVRVALADINRDGIADIITSVNEGSGKVRAYDGKTGQRLVIAGKMELNPFDQDSGRGVYVAAGDVNGDGIADIVIGDRGDGGKVMVYDGDTGAILSDFRPFAANASGHFEGVRVGIEDVNSDGIADIVVKQHSGLRDFSAFTLKGAADILNPVKII